MERIRVVVNGAMGRMGGEVVGALLRERDMEVVGAIDVRAEGDELSHPLSEKPIPLGKTPDILDKVKPHVVVDFSVRDAVLPLLRRCSERGINAVVGTTGIDDLLGEIEALAGDICIIVCPNFSIGANLMMEFSRMASRFFERAEIIELHHDRKVDSPSGTAIATAKGMIEGRGKSFEAKLPEKETIEGARGAIYEGIAIHSVRLPGLLAHQEVIFGLPGEVLRIRHDTISRECFLPGVIMAVREAVRRKGFIFGLREILGLRG